MGRITLAGTALTLACGGLASCSSGVDDTESTTPTVPTTVAPDGAVVVPDVIGLCADEARAQLDALGLALDDLQFDAVGEVTDQDPAGGERIGIGSAVALDLEPSSTC